MLLSSRLHSARSGSALVAILTLALSAGAQPVSVQWDAQGRYEKTLQVAPGDFLELCEHLPARSSVAWTFDADGPMDFNVHFHEGKDVHYPAKKNGVQKDTGTLSVSLEQDYCWMWSNESQDKRALHLQLKKE